MADNRKRFDLWLSFKDLKTIKHALEHYVKREGASQEDVKYEKELACRVSDLTSNIVE